MAAKNWTASEAAKVIIEGKDTEAIKEISKRFPLFTLLIAKNDLEGLMAIVPEHVTARKLETSAQENAGETTDDEIDEEETEKPTKGSKKTTKSKQVDDEDEVDDEEEDDEDGEDLESMSTKQLQALCAKKGIKVAKYGKNKQYYIDALNGASEDAEPEDDDEEEDDEYAGKSAKELFKLCKSRGIKVAPNKKADVYIKALKEADNESLDDEDDDWGDDEEEEKPVKKSSDKKSAPKASKGKSKQVEEDAEDEDDDDWDI